MELIAYAPPPRSWIGLDTAGDDHSPKNVIIPELAKAFYEDHDVRWVARYTRPDGKVLDNPQPGGDWQGCYSLSLAESRWILEAGLGIVPVQFGIFGDDARARDAGRAMAQCHRLLGFPADAHHFLDVEGRRPAAAGSAACKRYIEIAAAAALAEGSSAPAVGLYRTGQVPLDGHETYRLGGVTCYWAACGPTPPVCYRRGEGIIQRLPGQLAGLNCDMDMMIPDGFGGMPRVVCTVEAAQAWEAEALGLHHARPIPGF